jgi:hypothetical protein
MSDDVSIQQMVEEANEVAELCLTDWECNFISDMADKFEKWGADTFVSPKQEEIIRRIYEKVCESPY